MPGNYLDRFGRSATICHRLPPAFKLVATVAIVAIGVSVPIRYWPVEGALASLLFVAHALAEIPLAYVARRLAIFLPMVVMLSLSLPLAQGFQAGWEIGFAILVRSTVAFLATLWLVNVMPFDQLLVTLRRLWVPEALVAMLAFMYRYIFVLWDELDKMRVARRARTFGSGGLRQRWRISTHLIGMLLIRAMERAERIHGAMCARGWDGRVRTLEETRRS
jgi:cobalt/nickel transport system permease protein